ncbi:(Fe-S)-binding protein [Chitinasiproducens palmae]|uniref:L-lactate dehydrogenase complex protein LldE n=1 Tax=Chitinasiproducens palmae TaxID=1770053 RepID=A0A1H2PV86_9BURK|nr:(Fe-S)-binding protein [Chitinasiproducens palmae]SDV50347.1 L-lactate dehydrogenase complex protein LldE [Chitinasiproducens palmae]
MKVALFVPCFIDAFYPEVAVATLELLERFGLDVDYPMQQTCCGQPMANSGAEQEAAGAEQVFVRNFAGYDYIVGPSASCIHHIRSHLTAVEQTAEVQHIRERAWELTEFLHDVLGARSFPWAEFPHTVGLHVSCSALRHLKMASASEIAGPSFSKPRTLLEGVKGISFAQTERVDECCGFGGTFSVSEEAVSVRMGQDKVARHAAAGAEYIVSGDMSCLMHQQGCAQRMKLDTRFLHIAQVLNGVRA